jgi:hypothetical protein
VEEEVGGGRRRGWRRVREVKSLIHPPDYQRTRRVIMLCVFYLLLSRYQFELLQIDNYVRDGLHGGKSEQTNRRQLERVDVHGAPGAQLGRGDEREQSENEEVEHRLNE